MDNIIWSAVIIAVGAAAVIIAVTALISKGGDTRILESIKMMGEMLSKNQKDTDEYQSKKFAEIDRNITEKQAEMNKAVVDSLAQMETRFKTFEQSNEQKLEAMRETMTNSLLKMQEDNSKKLEDMRKTVDEKLQKTLESKMNESFRMVSERLEQVYKGLGEMQSLAVGVGDLKKVLSNVKTRGILGEIQLGAILKEILAPGQYDENVATVPNSRNVVEFAVKFPQEDGGFVYLPIDSKFPLDAYADLQNAYSDGDAQSIKAAAQTLCTRLRGAAKDVHEKYVLSPYTTEFAVIFLPVEGLYAEAVNRGMVELLQREYKIVIAGPSTMAALLNSLQMGFRTLAIEKRSAEVWTLLGAVKKEFDNFAGVLDSAQKKIEQANSELDKLVGVRTRAINRKLRNVELFDGDSTALLDIDTDDFKGDE